MSEPARKRPLNWSAVAVFAILGVLIVCGWTSQGLTLPQIFVCSCFAAALALIGWRLTARQTRKPRPRPLARWERVWNAAVFVGLMVVMAALVWWFVVERGGDRQPPTRSAGTDAIRPQD